MIVIYHTGKEVVTVTSTEGKEIAAISSTPIAVLYELVECFPEAFIGWCHIDFKNHVDLSELKDALHHKLVMVSDLRLQNNVIDSRISYVEESPFLKINYEVKYPTWHMSSAAGGVHASVLLQLKNQNLDTISFDYFLNSLAKACQSQGLFCYHAPLLKSDDPTSSEKQISKNHTTILYRFVKQHYKTRWVFFLLFAQLRYERKFPFITFFKALFISTQNSKFDATKISVSSLVTENRKMDIDVIIPTMGRSQYLYNVLQDLSKQTVLPEKVIIVEQNPDPSGSSDLGYLDTEPWPFQIKHTFIHKTGACNARNLALEQTTASWVFFADDDNRFDTDVIEKALKYLDTYQVDVLTTSYLQEHERKVFTIPKQWTTFGAGNSFVKGTLSRKLTFDTAYEHGYGEDTDYGMQLRNAGADILYHPDIELLHLKAPVGGFRKKIEQPWEQEKFKPKPSPTVMLYRLRHTTDEQLKGYRLRLFLRQLKTVNLRTVWSFRQKFQKQWDSSVKWAKYLDNS